MNISLSQKEMNQITTFEKLKEGLITQKKAATILELSTRQVRRRYLRYNLLGAQGLIHESRGRPSNNVTPPAKRSMALSLIRELYPDFGPTLATEKLLELHGIVISRENVRALMIQEDLWKSKTRSQAPVFQWRERKEHFGELSQLDGSDHSWFEERAPKCCLIAFIDDATGQIPWMEFAQSESTDSLFTALGHYLEYQVNLSRYILIEAVSTR